ncbi:MAG: transposase [Paraburkholderia sp.]|jgi:hypothetical protein|nr:transposase [Paraburkholderia sp.]
MADWLLACGVDTVALESTGVCWIPVYEVLEQRGLAGWLVDARDLATCRRSLRGAHGSAGSVSCYSPNRAASGAPRVYAELCAHGFAIRCSSVCNNK